jgi:hypothetical protein
LEVAGKSKKLIYLSGEISSNLLLASHFFLHIDSLEVEEGPTSPAQYLGKLHEDI